jgi:hypothetical protein
MLEYLQENSFPIIMAGLPVIGVLGFLAFVVGKRWATPALLGVLVLVISLVAYERVNVTDREYLDHSIYQMADCVRRNDVQGLLQHVSSQHPATYRRVQTEMPDYVFQSCNVMEISRIDLQRDVKPAKARVDFAVFVNVDASARYQYAGFVQRGVSLSFEKESDGVWRVVGFEHYDLREKY